VIEFTNLVTPQLSRGQIWRCSYETQVIAEGVWARRVQSQICGFRLQSFELHAAILHPRDINLYRKFKMAAAKPKILIMP